jgi:hypothetical protein
MPSTKLRTNRLSGPQERLLAAEPTSTWKADRMSHPERPPHANASLGPARHQQPTLVSGLHFGWFHVRLQLPGRRQLPAPQATPPA